MADQALASPIEITTSNDTLSFNYDGGGANDITVPNGTYGSILTVIYALNDAIYNCGGAPNNKVYIYLNSDYKVVIASRTAAFAIDWTDAPLMRMLGFRDDLAATGSYTATDTPRYLWMPPYYSADVNHRNDDTAIIGGNAIDGTFSGIALAPGNYVKKHRWEAVAAVDVMKSACEASYTYGSTYYPEEERCLEEFTIHALTASPTGTEGLSIKGCYYIEDMDEYNGFNAVTYIPNCPASMDGGGHRFYLDTSPDNFIFCHLRQARWTDPTPTLERINSLYNVGVELISAVGGVPIWSRP
jgi:hypothetical protein